MREREIVIRLPRAPRKRWLVMGGAVVLCLSAIVYATVPNVFGAGDAMSSAKLNTNFAALVDLTSDQTVAGKKTVSGRLILSRNGKTYSIGATYCGNSPVVSALPTG